MNNAQQLLTRLKAIHGGASDYRIAQILEISSQSVGRVTNGHNGFSDVTLNKIAQELGENPMLVIADYHLATQDFPSMNNIWEHMKLAAMKEDMDKYQGVIEEKLGDVSGL